MKVVVVEHWQRCSEVLKEELPPQQFGTWIRPLWAELEQTNLRLYAPNKFILDWVKNKYLARISDLLEEQTSGQLRVHLQVGTSYGGIAAPGEPLSAKVSSPPAASSQGNRLESRGMVGSHGKAGFRVDTIINGKLMHRGSLQPDNTFDSFINVSMRST